MKERVTLSYSLLASSQGKLNECSNCLANVMFSFNLGPDSSISGIPVMLSFQGGWRWGELSWGTQPSHASAYLHGRNSEWTWWPCDKCTMEWPSAEPQREDRLNQWIHVQSNHRSIQNFKNYTPGEEPSKVFGYLSIRTISNIYQKC